MYKILDLDPDIFGIDISDLSIKILKLKKNREGFLVESFNQTEIKYGLIQEGAIKDIDAVASIIKNTYEAVNGKKINTKYVVASLPEEKSFLEVIQMPIMSSKELALAIPFQIESYVPLAIDKVYYDFEIIENNGINSDHFDVLIVATPREVVDSYTNCLKKAGLIPVALEVESQAIARAMVKNEKSSYPVILIDFGQCSTDLIIFSANSTKFTVSLPISSGTITEAISKNLNISYKEAEKIKEKFDLYGKLNSESKKVSEIILPILKDVSDQIKKYIDFYKDHSMHDHTAKKENKEKVIFCGGGAKLKGLDKFFYEETKIPAEIGDPWTNIIKDKEQKDISSFSKNAISFSTAIGLAIRGADKNK